jgi:hypothetical protein
MHKLGAPMLITMLMRNLCDWLGLLLLCLAAFL